MRGQKRGWDPGCVGAAAFASERGQGGCVLRFLLACLPCYAVFLIGIVIVVSIVIRHARLSRFEMNTGREEGSGHVQGHGTEETEMSTRGMDRRRLGRTMARGHGGDRLCRLAGTGRKGPGPLIENVRSNWSVQWRRTVPAIRWIPFVIGRLCLTPPGSPILSSPAAIHGRDLPVTVSSTFKCMTSSSRSSPRRHCFVFVFERNRDRRVVCGDEEKSSTELSSRFTDG